MLRIPTIMTADEIIDSAFRRATKVQILSARSKIDLIRQKDIAKINSVSDRIETTLRGYVKAFPSLDRMPPFYREMIGLLVGTDQLKKSLGAVDWCADQVNRIARQYKSAMKRTKIVTSMDEIRSEMYGRTSSLVRQIDKDLRFLNRARDQIKALPTIDAETRAIVIAGAPNCRQEPARRGDIHCEAEDRDIPIHDQGDNGRSIHRQEDEVSGHRHARPAGQASG